MTITTRKWNPTPGKPARIFVESGVNGVTRNWDANLTDEQNHEKAAQHLAFSLGCHNCTLVRGKQKDGVMVHILTQRTDKNEQ